MNQRISKIAFYIFTILMLNVTFLSAFTASFSNWATKSNILGVMAGFGTATYNNKIFIFDGMTTLSTYNSSAVEMYDIDTDTWTSKTIKPTADRMSTAEVKEPHAMC